MSVLRSVVLAILTLSASALAADPSFTSVATVASSDKAHDILKAPRALAVVRTTGDVLVADTMHHRILRISVAGNVAVLAGSGMPGQADGHGADAQFKEPSGIAIDETRGLAYVADTGNHTIRAVTFDGNVSTLAGSGRPEDRDGQARQAGFKQPSGVAVDATGMVLVADTGNSRIKQITPSGVVTTIGGDVHEGLLDGPALSAQFKQPEGIAVGGDGTIYIADTKNNVIRKLRNGTVSTLAGTGHAGRIDGTRIVAEFNAPSGISCDDAGALYVADAANHAIRRVAANGDVTTVSGAGAGYVDGSLQVALFRQPSGIAFAGALFVADRGNDAVRRIDAVLSLRDIDPHTGSPAGGTQVHIFGSGFVPGSTQVTFGSLSATNVTYVTSTEIISTAPAVSGVVDVIVTTPAGVATLPSAYSTILPPTIATVAPAEGATTGGQVVTITGTNFIAGTTVRFGTTPATGVTVVTGNKLTALTPPNAAGTVDISVTTDGGTAIAPASFTYFAVPVIVNVSPAQGTAGTAVTINGANFDPDASGDTVLFGTLPALVSAASSSQLVVIVPNGATTGRITIVTVGGTAISSSDFAVTTYVALEVTAPVVEFAQGDGIPFNAIARTANGATADVSAQATWTTSDSNVATFADGFVIGQSPGTATVTAHFGGLASARSVTIRSLTVPIVLPTAVDQTVVQSLADSIRFLYSGVNAVQTGVVPNAISDDRVATVRGSVHTRDGSPIPGVEITVANHPEIGHTFTRADGVFDLAFNGGGGITLVYRKAGWLEAQRLVTSQWNDQKVVGDVVLVPFDAKTSVVTMGSTASQNAHATTVSDADGARTATLVIPAGESATITAADGTVTTPSSLHVRATEYTVGTSGPSAMPAPLPPMSAYTYCVELSADEAPGGTVRFTKPLALYFENFLGFPIGTAVPVGFFDRAKHNWIASRNARVVRITTITDGVAAVDINGDGAADTDAALAQLGIDLGERRQLASLYLAGQALWRASIDHFTPWDANAPSSPTGAPRPNVAKPKPGKGKTQSKCQVGGWSIIDCANQTLGESIPIQGTPYALEYDSSRAARNEYSTEIPLSDTTVPASLRRIELEVSIAGKLSELSFPPLPNQKYTFTWDGKDGFGRAVQGARTADVTITYFYTMAYGAPAIDPGWNSPASTPVSSTTTSRSYSLSQQSQVMLGHFDIANAGFGGWSFSAQRHYDGIGRTIYEAGGEQRSADPQQTGETVMSTLSLGTSTPSLFTTAPAPDGTLYYSDGNKIRKVAPDGSISDMAGTTQTGFTADGLPALGNPMSVWQIATAPDGTLYTIDNTRVRAIVNGRWVTVAGTDVFESGTPKPEGVLATSRPVTAWSLTLGPDGALYIGSVGNIYKVDPDGMIHTIAGIPLAGGTFVDFVDGAPALSLKLARTTGLAVGPDGTVYFANNAIVGRVTTDGRVFHVIPRRSGFFPQSVSVTGDGTLLVADSTGRKVWAVGSDGIVGTFAGTGQFDSNAPSQNVGASRSFMLRTPFEAKVAADGSVVLLDTGVARIRRAGSSFPPARIASIVMPSADGSVAYVFQSGRHVRTVDTLTNVTIETFQYDDAGNLIKITDVDGLDTQIVRNGVGEPTAIVAPNGQQTTLSVSNGNLLSITDPGHASYAFEYGGNNLLTSLTDRRGGVHRFFYDADGLLLRDEDPAGGFIGLARTGSGTAFNVSRTSAEGRTHLYTTAIDASGSELHTHVAPDGWSTSSTFYGGNSSVTVQTGSASIVSTADPRFGMAAPLASVTMTNGSKSLKLTQSRTVALSDPNNVLALSSLVETSSLNGKASTSTYDAATRTMSYRSPAGRQASAILDSKGRLSRMQLPALVDSTIAYDARGRIATISVGSRVITYSYDTLDRLQSITDPLNRTQSFTYDDSNRVTSQTMSDNRVVRFTYDAADNLTSVTPPSRPGHGFAFTSVDLLDLYEPPAVSNGGATAYAYDRDRHLIRITRPESAEINLSYDSGGRLAAITAPLAARTFDYDAVGRLSGINSPDSVALSNSYDGSLLTSQSWSGEISGTVAFTYDNDLRLASENGIAFGYDNDGLLTSAGALALTRDPQSGFLLGTTLGRVTDAWTYNAVGEPVSYKVSIGGAEAIRQEITRDDGGRITNIVEATATYSTTTAYTYNAAGQLATVTRNGQQVAEYTYDASGNRLSGAHDDQDRLLAANGATYSYTANGELATRTDSTGTTAYAYDGVGNLRSVFLPSGRRIDYVIDGQNRRVGKKVDGSLVTGWLYAGAARIVAEMDGAGTVTKRFIYGSRGNTPDYVVANGVTYRIITDHLGSPRFVLETSTGTVVEEKTYDAFGNYLVNDSSGIQPFGFAGGLYDPDTGLLRFGTRDYDPQTGRWTTKDPLALAGGDTNLYAYVYNDPINSVDPMGLYAVDDFVEDAVNFFAGFGDNLTFGLTNVIRNQIGGNEGVDHCSGIYSAGEWAGIATSTAIGAAGGLRAAGAKAAGKEFSHWIPGRFLRNAPEAISEGFGLSRANGNYVSAAEHALNDPFRYRFMPRAWKAENPINSALVRQLNRIPKALIGTGAGAAYGGASAATSGSDCGCQ